MQYAQRGGYTPAEQQRRQRLRLQAAERFARRDAVSEIARDLRVTEDLRVLRGITPRQQHQPAEHPDYEEIDEADEHERRA